ERKKSDFVQTATVFKRAANIIADAPEGDRAAKLDESLLAHASEKALFAKLGQVEQEIVGAKKRAAWGDALSAAGKLYKLIDDLFNGVMVMDKDAKLRRNRLALLKRVVDL